MKKIFSITVFLFAILTLHAQTSGNATPPPVPDPTIKQGDSIAYLFAEIMPTYPGSEDAFANYLTQNIKFPDAEKEAGKTGTVYIQFTVEKNGSITNVHAVKEVVGAAGFTKESIRVISQMPNWNAGKMAGSAVRVALTVPIKFVLDGGSSAPASVCGKYERLGNVFAFDTGRIPQYVGGDDSLQAKIAAGDSLFRSHADKTSGMTIELSFIIDTSGQLCNLVLEKNLLDNPMFGYYVANIFCDMPKWIPGGVGYYGKNGSVNLNIKLRAFVFLGEYANGKTIKKASITLDDLGPPPPPPEPPVPPLIFPTTTPTQTTSSTGVKQTLVMPQFPGGDSAYQAYIEKNLIYPEAEKRMHRTGAIIISLTVEADGSVSSVRAQNAVIGAPEFTNEAVRLIKNMPKWIPGTIDNKPTAIPTRVIVYFTL